MNFSYDILFYYKRLHIGCILVSHYSRTNNKRVVSTFNFGYRHLTLKEGQI